MLNKNLILLTIVTILISFNQQIYASDFKEPSIGALGKEKRNAHVESNEIHWSYDGKGGPKNWGRIKREFRTCRVGKMQSPIDLQSTISSPLPALEADYYMTPLRILNNGHTVQVNYNQGSIMSIGEKKYNLLQLHFHTPSEHNLENIKYPMEVHFVHKRDDGTLGVLGIMIKEGANNTAIEGIWNYLPMSKTSEKVYNNIYINGGDLLPDNLEYYYYMGSLTTPPCNEGVNWHVLKTPIEFSSSQIEKFKSVFAVNARPLQPINNRLIVAD